MTTKYLFDSPLSSSGCWLSSLIWSIWRVKFIELHNTIRCCYNMDKFTLLRPSDTYIYICKCILYLFWFSQHVIMLWSKAFQLYNLDIGFCTKSITAGSIRGVKYLFSMFHSAVFLIQLSYSMIIWTEIEGHVLLYQPPIVTVSSRMNYTKINFDYFCSELSTSVLFYQALFAAVIQITSLWNF